MVKNSNNYEAIELFKFYERNSIDIEFIRRRMEFDWSWPNWQFSVYIKQRFLWIVIYLPKLSWAKLNSQDSFLRDSLVEWCQGQEGHIYCIHEAEDRLLILIGEIFSWIKNYLNIDRFDFQQKMERYFY